MAGVAVWTKLLGSVKPAYAGERRRAISGVVRGGVERSPFARALKGKCAGWIVALNGWPRLSMNLGLILTDPRIQGVKTDIRRMVLLNA